MNASSIHPPTHYQRVAVRDLRNLPIRENPRLKILDYRLTAAPGMARKPRSHGHGAVLVADAYTLCVCLTRIDDAWFLEVERRCYDIDAAGRTDTALTAAQLADIYRRLQQRQILVNARRNAQKRRN